MPGSAQSPPAPAARGWTGRTAACQTPGALQSLCRPPVPAQQLRSQQLCAALQACITGNCSSTVVRASATVRDSCTDTGRPALTLKISSLCTLGQQRWHRSQLLQHAATIYAADSLTHPQLFRQRASQCAHSTAAALACIATGLEPYSSSAPATSALQQDEMPSDLPVCQSCCVVRASCAYSPACNHRNANGKTRQKGDV